MIRLAVVSVARSDYSILRPVLKVMASDARLKMDIIATGMHLSPAFVMTVNGIAAGMRNTG